MVYVCQRNEYYPAQIPKQLPKESSKSVALGGRRGKVYIQDFDSKGELKGKEGGWRRIDKEAPSDGFFGHKTESDTRR